MRQQRDPIAYFADIAAAVHSSLARLSQDTPLDPGGETSGPHGQSEMPGWTTHTHEGNPNEVIPSRGVQPSRDPWHGLQVVGVALLSSTLLIAFTWRETGEEV